MVQIDKELENSINWNYKNVDKLEVFHTDAKCDIQTKKRLQCKNDLFELLEISRPIDLLSMLDGKKLSWHITPIFNKNIAIRSMGSIPEIGYDLLNENYTTLVRLDNKIIRLSQNSYSGGYVIPSSPPMVPKNVVEIANKIKSFQKTEVIKKNWFSKKKIKKYNFDCEPMILYKPDTWEVVKIDPALVAKIAGEWRVFVIWGDIVEQAEIISFEKN